MLAGFYLLSVLLHLTFVRMIYSTKQLNLLFPEVNFLFVFMSNYKTGMIDYFIISSEL